MGTARAGEVRAVLTIVAFHVVASAGCYDGVSPSAASGPGPGTFATDGSGTADSSSGDGGSGDAQSQCGEPSPGASPLRRLTPWEYDNTVLDLLGDATSPGSDFPEEGGSGFDNNADTGVVTRLTADKYMLAAELVAARAVGTVDALLGCGAGEPEDACVGAWLTTFGRRAWRRPLAEDEHAALMALFVDQRAEADRAVAVSAVIERLLQSPHFLYRVELYDLATEASAVALGDWEIASRLSYFLWGSMPDDDLFDAAQAGKLRTLDEVEAQTRRMLLDPRARRAVTHFHEQWLGYQRLATIDKDTAVFPSWSPEIASKQREEADAFVQHVIFEGDGDLATLLTAPYTFADAALADFYGVTLPSGESWQQVEPGDRDVAGVLTQGGILAAHAKPNQTNPIARGLFIREQFLCTLPPPPPEGVELPPVDPTASAREQLEQHRADPACAACHQLFDPIGLGFEQFDAVGRWRTTEYDKPIDASGTLAATDVDGGFDGPAELAARLAESEDVATCVARQWLRYAYGRVENADGDACNLETIGEAFADSEHDLRELIVALTLSDGFRFRAVQGGA